MYVPYTKSGGKRMLAKRRMGQAENKVKNGGSIFSRARTIHSWMMNSVGCSKIADLCLPVGAPERIHSHGRGEDRSDNTAAIDKPGNPPQNAWWACQMVLIEEGSLSSRTLHWRGSMARGAGYNVCVHTISDGSV